jgi:protocatechuate 3,4-dioxygenase beta subunit
MKLQYSLSIFYVAAFLFSSCARKEPAPSREIHAAVTKENIPHEMKYLSGGACEGCNLMFLGMPLQLSAVDTSPGWSEPGQKLKIEGKILEPDQKTPASDVILYYYHTDQKGYYTPRDDMPPSAKRHGYLRGWVKTGPDGKYAIYTSRPAQYPNEKIEAHIHVFIKEPYIDVPYAISEWIFNDDPLVTDALRKKLDNRGGDSVLEVKKENDVQVAHHDVVLGLNIPNYPK